MAGGSTDLLLLLMTFGILLIITKAYDLPCSSVKYAYTAKGFKDDEVPQQAISGEHLRICERGLTCCTQEMENRLSTQSRAEFDRLLKSTIGEVRSVLATKAHQFDEFFKNLLSKSQKDFDDMFKKTYGMLYETNSYIFVDMFSDLKKYYDTGTIDLTDALENFFDKLYKKMFQVLNSQYTFESSYLNCISERMEEMKPFGDIPKKLTLEVSRSFVATRTFVQALSIGRDVVKNLMEVGPTPECSDALMMMTYCPHCRGHPELKPCANYCANVMRGCLAHHMQIQSEWKNFTEALELLGGRLENSFSIESVVDPIDIKISEAIMNFQENGPAVSQKLFEICGRPRLGKRNTKTEIHFEKMKFNYPSQQQESSLNLMIQGIKKKVHRTQNFWLQLPQAMCRHPEVGGVETPTATAVTNGGDCWDGLNKTGSEFGTGLDSSHHNAVISQSLLTLKLITNKLQLAYNGVNVDWEDADSDWVSSGSGSGSGYGQEESVVTDNYGDIYFSSSTVNVPRWSQQPTKKPSSASAVRTSLQATLFFLFVALLRL